MKCRPMLGAGVCARGSRSGVVLPVPQDVAKSGRAFVLTVFQGWTLKSTEPHGRAVGLWTMKAAVSRLERRAGVRVG